MLSHKNKTLRPRQRESLAARCTARSSERASFRWTGPGWARGAAQLRRQPSVAKSFGTSGKAASSSHAAMGPTSGAGMTEPVSWSSP